MACNDLPPVATDAAWSRAGLIDAGRAHPHVWLAAGHGMLGISMSAGNGQLIADLVCVRTPVIDPAPYRPERFR